VPSLRHLPAATRVPCSSLRLHFKNFIHFTYFTLETPFGDASPLAARLVAPLCLTWRRDTRKPPIPPSSLLISTSSSSHMPLHVSWSSCLPLPTFPQRRRGLHIPPSLRPATSSSSSSAWHFPRAIVPSQPSSSIAQRTPVPFLPCTLSPPAPPAPSPFSIPFLSSCQEALVSPLFPTSVILVIVFTPLCFFLPFLSHGRTARPILPPSLGCPRKAARSLAARSPAPATASS
jgi:hypothetical protein